MKKMFFLFFFLFAVQSITSARQSQDILPYLKAHLPGAEIQSLAPRDHFSAAYEIMLPQALDHKNPDAGYFMQRIFISHVDTRQPVVFVTEGYNAVHSTYELSKMLKANQVMVEYRFFGASIPQQKDWAYLKNDQAIEDLHRIRALLKKLYRKKWLATGISKGGTTTLIYKSKYPRDVRVCVPYVAPLANAQEDNRTDIHQVTIGTATCRKDIVDLQRKALKLRKEMLLLLHEFAEENNHEFSLGFGKVLEYAVLEFPFSFWQWNGDCKTIPKADAGTKEVFDFINEVVGFDFYSDQTCAFYLPSYYQFMTELGYYGFPTEAVEDLLVEAREPSNLIFAPRDTDLSFQYYLKPVEEFLARKGKRIIYIYGELDTWTACGVIPNPRTKSLRMTKAGGNHRTRIKSFSTKNRKIIYDHLEKWMKADISPLP